MAFLLDTCVWVDVERGRLAPGDVGSLTRGDAVYLSPVVLAELRFGAEIASEPAARQRRTAALARLVHVPVLPMDAQTGQTFGLLAAQLRAAGRDHAHRIQDLWMASQAIQHGCRLLTRNQRHFTDLPGLDLVAY